MSNRTCFKRTRAGIGVAVCFAFLSVPVAAQADHVDLGTASPFVALGGAAVTNTGPSVLDGDLGVFQAGGGALTGFFAVDGGPGVVNGAIHDDDVVAQQAQADLTTAYNAAAGEASTANLTGQDLGLVGVLTPGVYTFSTSAQLTGQLTLDAGGNPDAQFIFQIGSTLTTAPGASVVLAPGTSPCNIYWQVGASATIDTGTQFAGNILADQSISLESAATITGRALARIGSVTLINNTLDNTDCTATPGGGGGSGGGTPDGGDGGGGAAPPASPAPTDGTTPGNGTQPGTGIINRPPPQSQTRVPTRNGTATFRRPPSSRSRACTDGFRATVTGRMIRRVVFRLDGKRIASRTGSPFRVYVSARPGRHNVTAHVTYRDATRAKTLNLGYRGCAAQLLRPRRGPSQFTG